MAKELPTWNPFFKFADQIYNEDLPEYEQASNLLLGGSSSIFFLTELPVVPRCEPWCWNMNPYISPINDPVLQYSIHEASGVMDTG